MPTRQLRVTTLLLLLLPALSLASTSGQSVPPASPFRTASDPIPLAAAVDATPFDLFGGGPRQLVTQPPGLSLGLFRPPSYRLLSISNALRQNSAPHGVPAEVTCGPHGGTDLTTTPVTVTATVYDAPTDERDGSTTDAIRYDAAVTTAEIPIFGPDNPAGIGYDATDQLYDADMRFDYDAAHRLATTRGDVGRISRVRFTSTRLLSGACISSWDLLNRPIQWTCGPTHYDAAGMLFQGAWTDPVTGLAYHRQRWYDPRTASWLSEDAYGDIDSPNLYAFVGWGPHGAVDPMGLCDGSVEILCPDAALNAAGGAINSAYSWATSDGLYDGYMGARDRSTQFAGQMGVGAVHAIPQLVADVQTFLQDPGRYLAEGAVSSALLVHAIAQDPDAVAAALGRSLVDSDPDAMAQAIGSALTQAVVAGALESTEAVRLMQQLQKASIKADLALANRIGKVRQQLAVQPPSTVVAGLGPGAQSALEMTGGVSPTVGELRSAGARDAHHVIQDAAVRDLIGYETNAAPGVALEGPSNVVGTQHYRATQSQRRPAGGTYAAERRIAYRALREAGLSPGEAKAAILRADEYFASLGVTKETPTRVPGNRRK